MQLIEINKVRYRRHLNFVIAGCICGLAIGSLAISQTFIAIFPDERDLLLLNFHSATSQSRSSKIALKENHHVS